MSATIPDSKCSPNLQISSVSLCTLCVSVVNIPEMNHTSETWSSHGPQPKVARRCYAAAP